MEVVDGVFVDTSAWFAVVVPEDLNHSPAVRMLDRITQRREPLTTTDWVLSETVAVLENRVSRMVARRAGELILGNPVVRLICMDRDQIERAWARYGNGPPVSLVDCSSFVVMEDLGLTRAFAFDEDFARAGFRVEV